LRQVLENEIADHNVHTLHSIQNLWEAPFFYEDSRHVFYITTEKRLVPVPMWDNFGVMESVASSVAQIPPLVLEEAIHRKPKPKPDRFVNAVVDGTVPIQHFVTEDAYIDKAIGTTDRIVYNDVEVEAQGGKFGEQYSF
jgi:hypothetical protein